MTMNIVLLGAPGAGKGTQAAKLSEALGLPHISTGDIFRKNISERTPIGIVAQGYIDGGNLVPDGVTVEIVKDRLKQADCKAGFILDGFPRNVAQANMMEEFAATDVAVDVDVPLEGLMARLTGRRVCENCGLSYHVSSLGGKTKCSCGGKLVRRADDEEATVAERIKVYRIQTEPLIAYYKERGLLRTVDGGKSPDDVFEEVLAAVKEI